MRRTPRSFLLAIAALATAAVTTLAGCSTGPSKADIAWADGVCGPMLSFFNVLKTQPNINQSEPAALVEGISGYLNGASNALQSTIDSLHNLGPSPIDGGDALISELDKTLVTLKGSFDESTAQLAAVNTSDPASALTAVQGALTPLQEAKLDTSGLNGNPEINAAAQQAPHCQQLGAVSGG